MVQRVGRCIQQAACSFRRAGVPDPEQSALQLMLSAHGLSRRSELELDRELDPSVLREWETMCARRRNREPVQYIVGEWDFHDLTLSCKPPVLIPRPETEQLVELILENVAQNENTKHTPAYRLLDVGSGTGAIGLALLAKLGNGSECVGIDSSEEACLLSRQNRDRVQLPPASTYSAVHSSINKYQDQSGSGFDFVVSNPPYIPHKARAELQPEVMELSLIHISEPTRLLSISYAVFCLKKKKKKNKIA
eukprot:TRINITY_DN5537_c0_g1_i12.p1 TRINITY_DN5537_c0_g1~~TRINITY_DN5537_c0_g1_i12.p1  ORF type:complete len:250 (-),score=55.85 TRINITY_DN5537_c0_g1_i12:108-857(-)